MGELIESAIRRIVANNESRGVNIPPRMWRALGLAKGDYVRVQLHGTEESPCIVLTPASRKEGVEDGG